MPKYFFFLKDPSLLAAGDAPVEGDGTPLAEVPEWVNVLPEPEVVDGKLVIYSRDNRVLHIDSMEKLAKRSNAALKKQKGGGLVDADHQAAMWGGAAIAWAEEFEARPGKGMWARADWLTAGEQLVGSKQYRYTSSVVTGEVDAEVDLEEWTVTWHITPDTVDGFAVTNIPALATTSMFADRSGEQEREAILAVLLRKLGVDHANPTMPAVREAFSKLFQFTAGETAREADSPPRNAEKPTTTPEGDPPPLKKDDASAEGTPGTGEPAVVLPTDPAAPDELALARAELATARTRIAALEVEAGAAFVKSLLHSGRLTPAQRKAAEEQAKTPTGLAQLQALYEHAPTSLPTRAAPHAASSAPATAPYGLMPLSYRLAREGVPAHEIAERLKETT